MLQGGKECAKLKLSRNTSCGFDANTMWLAPCRITKRPLGASDLKLAVRRTDQTKKFRLIWPPRAMR